MIFPRRTINQRVFTASWLLLYAVAGLIVHAPYGHVHDHAHHDAISGVEHVHGGHAHSHHSHTHAADHHHATDLNQKADDSSQTPVAPVHDDDCAGCQLLGSISAPTPAAELVEAGRLNLAAPVLVISVHAADLIGISLARAPPATI